MAAVEDDVVHVRGPAHSHTHRASRQLQDEPGQLRIRSSRPRKTEFINLIIGVSGSVSGLVVNGEQEFLYINPNHENYRARYLNYTSSELSKRRRSDDSINVQSELVVPIKYKGKVIAVLNLEAKTENAFSQLQVAHLVTYSQRIGLLLKMLEMQWRILYEGPKLAQDATGKYLEAYTAHLNHDIMTPLHTLEAAIEALSDIVNDTKFKIDLNRINAQIETVRSQRQRLEARAEAVINRLGLLKEQDINVRQLIAETLIDLKQFHRLDDELDFVAFSNSVQHQYIIHTHGLVRAYLFQLLDNAARSLRAKQKLNSDFKGKIHIGFKKIKHFNGVYFDEYGVIDILDNGLGVITKQLAQLRKFNAGTRFRTDSGKGDALVATQHYLKQQGGWLDIDSKEGEFFRVRLAFRSLSEA